MRVANVLRHDVTGLALYLLFLTYDFDASATRWSWRLHDVHVPIVLSLTIHAELTIIFWEKVSFRAKVELGEDFAHSTDVLPHEVLAAHLEWLWEMIHLLILGGLFEMLRLGLTGPHDVPFGAIWAHNSESCCLQRVDYRVIDVSSLWNLETQDHVVLFEVFLASHLHLLELSKMRFGGPVVCFQEACPLLHCRWSCLSFCLSIRCARIVSIF